MRAAVVNRYGPPEVVRIEDVATPEPRSDQVLVRVHAAAVTSGDARIRGARFPAGFGPLARLALGLRGPRRSILGGCFSGVVESVGPKVTGLSAGDPVAGMTGVRMGTHAEYVAVPAARAVPVPAGVSHEQAAGVLFGGTTALHYLHRLGSIGPGSTVLVNGGSGAVGTNAVQLARHAGATVTAVCSARNRDLMVELGATHVIDHTRTELAAVSDRFDIVLDAVGNLSPGTGRPLLAPDGVLLLAAASLGQTIRARGNVKAGPAAERAEAFTELLDLVAAGTLSVVLDEVSGLEDIVAAYRLVDSGRKVGNVVVRPIN